MPAITTVNELQAMQDDLAGTYWLANDIDASATVGWNAGAGFEPIGTSVNPFTGSFDGKGFTITELYIDRPATDYIGLFGVIYAGAILRDCLLENVDITGFSYTGGLVGYAYETLGDTDYPEVYDCNVNGTVTGRYGGGLVGGASGVLIYDSHADVVGNFSSMPAGGLIGEAVSGTIIQRCSSKGDIAGSRFVGGFIGSSSADEITESYATGNVTSHDGVAGGFMAGHYGISIKDCYALGDITETVAGFGMIGGFVGENESTIENSYSIGTPSGFADVGGFCGSNNVGLGGVITNCFWDTQTSGTAVSDGGTGKTTSQMKTKSTFTSAGWDFIVIWFIDQRLNDGYPCFFAMPPEALPSAPRATVAVEDKITLESIRNVEMAAGGRFYVDEEGNAVYRSRYARNA